jgi:hypothetical protein
MLAALNRESHLALNSHQTAESLSAILLMKMASVMVGIHNRRKMPNPEDFLLRLGLCRGRRNRAADSENDREPDQPHGHLVEDG